jgi:predicted RNA binding protein YcfA (HicA-like mRNA interferase family)
MSQSPSTVPRMPPLPRLTGREVVRALERLGWVLVAQKGSDARIKHPTEVVG